MRVNKKIVINTCYGGFGLSHKAMMLYAEKKGITLVPYAERYNIKNGQAKWKKLKDYKKCNSLVYYFTKDFGQSITEYPDREFTFMDCDIERNDPVLVEVVEELGKKSWGECARLSVEEYPPDVLVRVQEYDGKERLVEMTEGEFF